MNIFVFQATPIELFTLYLLLKSRIGCWVIEEHLRFQKGDIQSDIGSPGKRVITSVAFLMSGITQKNTTKSTWIKFASLIFVEMNEGYTTKNARGKHQNRGQRLVLREQL
ncbi:hypothetical protein L3X38_004990 [Prunus dulcis]|uniref:Uncharacterized protein n=1 Tax=Prunus dulcis TaxID=3755 RepID=A0AAD5F3P9_PRUDU|nr:hypothetical protein L3X38_004990 [Prunus dulcis]